MKRSPKTDLPSERPRQDVPGEVIGRLLGLVRGQFCGELTDKEWFQHRRFVQAKVLLWPAGFMVGKGFTLPVARYETIMRGIFAEIKQHGQTGAVRYWPGYLMKCVQDHWRHHWEEYYQEAKSARSLAESMLVACQGKAAPEDRGVEVLAAAQRVLSGSRRKRVTAVKQLSLFGS